MQRKPAMTARLLACAILIAGCTDIVSVALDERNRTINVQEGQQIDINLGTVGPGDYESPPDIAVPVVRFVGVEYVGPYVPAGPRQRFRFEAVAKGTTTITFRHTGMGATVQDTVIVR